MCLEKIQNIIIQQGSHFVEHIEIKNRTPKGRDLNSPEDHTTFRFDTQSASDDHPGRSRRGKNMVKPIRTIGPGTLVSGLLARIWVPRCRGGLDRGMPP